MAVPTFDQMLRPLLALAAEGAITRRSATDAMVQHFKLSEADQLARIPSDSSYRRCLFSLPICSSGRCFL
jgi:hypothetical protein